MGMESFKTGSGLVDEFDFTITDAQFAYDVKIAEGEIPLLKLTGLNSVNGRNDESIWLKCGQNTEVIDGGAAIAFLKGNLINRQSQYGKWIDAFVDNEQGLKAIETRDMDALRASSWIGLTISLRRVMKPVKINGEDREMQEWAIDGVSWDGAEAPTATAPTAAQIPSAKNKKAVEIARNTPTYENFVDRCYEEIPGLVGAAYEDDLISTEFYEGARS